MSCQGSDRELLGLVREHFVQLTKFAHSDGAQRHCPKFNAYINILYAGDEATGDGDKASSGKQPRVLQRCRLDKSLASEYFTGTKPSTGAVSTIEGLETGHLSPHSFFFTVVVGEGISVAASGDEALFGGDSAAMTMLVDLFVAELTGILERA